MSLTPITLVTPDGAKYTFDVYIDEKLRGWVKFKDIIKILSLENEKECQECATKHNPSNICTWRDLRLSYLTSHIPLNRQLPKIYYNLETLFINETGIHVLILEYKQTSVFENWFIDNISLKIRESEIYNSIKTTLYMAALKIKLSEVSKLCEHRSNKILFALQFAQAREQYLKSISKQIDSLNKQTCLLREFLCSEPDPEDEELVNMAIFDEEDYEKFSHFDKPDLELALELTDIGKQKIHEILKPYMNLKNKKK